ncbi:MAG: hypothetical protein HKO87_06605 [Acidimicrobiia bacterium]|nr:hypothetical protein [Acidimicrobiia bacterium]
MPSDKRERQRANRASKQAEQSKAIRRQQLIKRARQLALLVAAMLLFAVVLSFINSDDTPETESAPSHPVVVVA